MGKSKNSKKGSSSAQQCRYEDERREKPYFKNDWFLRKPSRCNIRADISKFEVYIPLESTTQPLS